MKASTISFDVWCRNHSHDHNAKWCRELYPWEIFQHIDYNKVASEAPQSFALGRTRYHAWVERRTVREDGRTDYFVRVRSLFSSKRQQWEERAWNDLFHLVASSSGDFITVFTHKKDPTKVLLKKFLRGHLADIETVRSLPVSSLLFRGLLSTAAHDRYDGLRRFEEFQINSSQLPSIPRHGLKRESYEPFLSRNRDLWIICSFTEEKAHRQALRLSGQTQRLLAVFCHPTFTRHHRCSHDTVSVTSLSEFLRELSPGIHKRYVPHARFLVNHLRQDSNDQEENLQSGSIRELVHKTDRPLRIHTSDLREAKAGLGLIIATAGEVAYVCACANMLNAALNRRLQTYDGSVALAKEVYSFKAIFGRAIDDILRNPPPGVKLYVEPDGLLYVSVRGLQFSFHAVPRTPAVRAYQRSSQNAPQAWSGKRLQPVAPLVLRWARSLLLEESPAVCDAAADLTPDR